MKLKLQIELIPATAWGENIRRALGQTKWNQLRKKVLAEQGNTCATCNSTVRLQCHEVWEFDDKTCIQHLKGFQASCSLCHLGSHFGLAQKLAKQGHVDLEKVVSHFMEVNGITFDQFKEHADEMGKIFKKRSVCKWTQDFREWSHLLEK